MVQNAAIANPVTQKRSNETSSSLIGGGTASEYTIHLSPPLNEKPAFSMFPPLERMLVTPNNPFTEEDHLILKLPTIVITCM